MSNQKISSKDLKQIGFIKDTSVSIAIITASKYFKHEAKADLLQLFQLVMQEPHKFKEHDTLNKLANTFIEKVKENKFTVHELNNQAGPIKIYGYQHIDEIARKQMEMVMRLPISIRGALMPDAHSGYGLPVGGVVATENAVIPYGVGVDIGCRMALSIYELPEKYIDHSGYALKQALRNYTHFGMDGNLEFKQYHEVLDRNEFRQTELLRKLHGKAIRQLGSSGGGNHFVEFGVTQLFEHNQLNLPAGNYLSLLSHSGSRGLGAAIAKHYTQMAMDHCKLPKEAQHLAWLTMDSAEGQEYWMSMSLAGDYARACHQRIHANLSKALGITPMACVENHHNFAWKETMANGAEVIVHRKGATPAHEGELGIIPGSMIHPGYIVSGKGVETSLNSASHGAGRCMSRRSASESIAMSDFKRMLQNAGTTLIGGTTEESPMAYKNIDEIMLEQSDLVTIEGKFFPRIVRMNKE